jgi:hypothetical protein
LSKKKEESMWKWKREEGGEERNKGKERERAISKKARESKRALASE